MIILNPAIFYFNGSYELCVMVVKCRCVPDVTRMSNTNSRGGKYQAVPTGVICTDAE